MAFLQLADLPDLTRSVPLCESQGATLHPLQTFKAAFKLAPRLLNEATMNRFAFAQLPLVAQTMTMGSIFMAWVLVEEFEIDRHHLDRFLPFYKVGDLCIYDLAAATLIVALWFSLRQRGLRPG